MTIRMWPFPPKRTLRAVDDDNGQPRDEVHSRLDRIEADVEDLYDRLKRLTGRLSKRDERDRDTEPADGSGSATRGRLPSLAAMRARGQDPFRRS